MKRMILLVFAALWSDYPHLPRTRSSCTWTRAMPRAGSFMSI